MKKTLFLFLVLLVCAWSSNAQKQMIINTTGYGFDRTAPNGINIDQWAYIQKFVNITYNGQDASVSAVRLHVQWEQYEPTTGNYGNSGTKLAQAVAAILALKSGIKVALHFQYMRGGYTQETYFADNEIAKIADGTKVQNEIGYTCPSIFSSTAKSRFMAFVSHAMSAVSAYYSDILYVQMGNATGEEFNIPTLPLGAGVTPGFYEEKALEAWRTQYLPCRYPGQSTVIWNGTTRTIASAPAFAPGQWDDWSSDHGKEYHRFASWGLMKFFKEFRDIVKSKSSSLKVLYFVCYFGTWPGNMQTMHNASIPMALNESDGIYTSDGINQYDNQKKIMPADIIKGTNSSKIAGIEFDQEDLGQENPSTSTSPINASIAQEWMARAYKHGVDYIHLAMHFNDVQIGQLKPVLAAMRSTYLNGSYTSPAHQAPVSVGIVPNVFTGTSLFENTYNNIGGSTWSSSDVSPKSISMTDDGYWQNIWSCTSTPDPCAFNISASANNGSPTVSTPVTLTASCSGECSGVTYSWSGNGISGTGSTNSFNAPATAGTYTYTLTASKSGCSNKTTTVTLNVQASGGGGTNPCNYVDKQTVGTWSGLNVQTRQYTVNGSTGWLIVTAVPGSSVDKHFPRGKNFADRTDISWTITINKTCLVGGETGYSGLVFPSGVTVPSGYSQGTETDGAVYFQQTGGGCSTPAAPTLSASPSSITSGSSSTLSASGCSGGTINWSNGLGAGTSKTVSPTSTTTYTATCTIGACTSSNGSVTVTVTTPSGGCIVNKVRLQFRQSGECCMDRLPGAKIQGSNNGSTWTDIYTFTANGTGSWQEFTFSNSIAYSSLRFQASSIGWGELYELEFYKGTAKLTGTPFGVGNYANAFDGNLTTDWQVSSNPGSNNYAGLNSLGNCSGSPVVLDLVDPGQINKKLSLLVSPNPSKGLFQTQFYIEKGENATLSVIDLHGRTVYRQSLKGQGVHVQNINLLNKASGVLFLQLRKENGKVEVKKINITR